MREKEIAKETVAALERGQYVAPNGDPVDFGSLRRRCVEHTRCYSPDDLHTLRADLLATPPPLAQTIIEVVNESTLAGCARLLAETPAAKITALNFASARNPGGGFLGGARAQEESLARSSGLYHSLLRCPDYYIYHRRHKSLLYSDRMIYSPACPILRDDKGQWLPQPYTVDFITSAAPNAGAIAHNHSSDAAHIPAVFRERISKVLALAAHHGREVLILGAWGCGAFGNDPQQVADLFWPFLQPTGPFWGRFQRVVFSVLDSRNEASGNYQTFARRFSGSKTNSPPPL